MKKIITVFSFTGIAFTASAQLNDFLDIQKQLLKKQKENKLLYKKPVIKLRVQNKLNYSQEVSPLNQGRLSHTLPNGDKVYLLSQDNMPCIVPDMSKLNSFFNIYKNFNQILLPNHFPGKIPNAGDLKKVF